MDGDRDARPDPPNRFSRAPGVEMTCPEAWSPTPDRQKCNIDGSRESVHLGTEIRVAREVDRRTLTDPIAQCLSGRAERTPSPVVLGPYRLNSDPAYLDSFSGRDLRDGMPGAGHELSESFWHQNLGPSADAAKRRQVKMVVVAVRDQHDVDVDVLEKVRHGVAVPMEQAEPILEQRVGENADAIHLDQDGRVPEVAKMSSHRPSVMRA